MKKIATITVIAAISLVCFVAGTVVVLNPSQTSTTSTQPSSFTVVDALGRTVQIALPVERVIITGKSAFPITSVAYTFQSTPDILYGLDSRTASTALLRMVDPGIDSKVVSDNFEFASNTPNVEEIARLDPDVVVFKTAVELQTADSLDALGIKSVYIDLENLDGYVRDVRVMGRIFNDESKGNALAEYYEEKYDYVLSRTASAPMPERPRVLLLYYSTKGGTISFNAPGASWLQTLMINAAGGNALSNELTGTGWNVVSFEQIASWDPEIMFTVTYSSNPFPSNIRDNLLSDPIWADITAVREGKVYAVPDDCGNVGAVGSWESPCSRWMLGQLWMAKRIQPSLFADLDLTSETREFYMNMYGLSGDQAVTMLGQISGDFE